MGYLIRALLSNSQHYELGGVDILFPLKNEDYSESLQQLSERHIGDATAQDCMVKDIYSDYDVLQCLKGQEVNVDELDYLAKRLDSFDEYEDALYQAACHIFGLHDIKDLINMTFCFRAATVIRDFNKLEEAGKQHYLTIHGGSIPAEELDTVDGQALAQQLIQSGEGKATPYGLFFRNGMRMEELYQGHGFPPFLCDERQAELEFKKPDGTKAIIFLPFTELEFDRFRQRADIPDIKMCERTLRLLNGQGGTFSLEGGMAELDEWNEFCDTLNVMSEYHQLLFAAALEVIGAEDLSQMELLTANLDDFELVADVKDAEGYGRYMIQDSCKYRYDVNLECYYNYEALGEFLMTHEAGRITQPGYIKCEEDSAFLDFFTQISPEGAAGGIKRQGKISVIVTPMGQPEKQECLVLPCPTDQITRTLQQLGVASLQACSISVDTDRICPAVLSVFEDEFDIAEHFETFNLLARCYHGFDDDTIDRFHVVFDCVRPQNPGEVLYLAQSITEFVVVPDISTEEEYGYHLAQKSDFLAPDLLEHNNYKSLGAAHIQAEHGLFGDKGYVAYTGTDPQITAMLARFASPQHEAAAEMSEESMTMGGM